jgi:hypothetical protein
MRSGFLCAHAMKTVPIGRPKRSARKVGAPTFFQSGVVKNKVGNGSLWPKIPD